MNQWSPELQAWAALATAVVGALLLLYLIQPRRRQVQVPYGGLWRQVLAQVEARTFGKRWQRLLSFLVMAAIAGLLLTALLEPLWRPERAGPPPRRWSTVWVVDCSASMATEDGAIGSSRVTRLRQARHALAQAIQAAPPDEDMLLATASGHLQVLAGWGSDRRQLLAMLDAIEPTQGGLDLRQVVDRAGQMLQGRPGPRLVLVTDGGRPLEPVTDPSIPLQTMWVGPARQLPAAPDLRDKALLTLRSQPIDNLAIAELRIRPQADDPDRGTLTAQVRNDTGRPVAARLLVSASPSAQLISELSQDRNLRRLLEVELPVGATSVLVSDLELLDARFGVRVQAREPGFVDRAAWDDWGLAVLAEQRRLKVLWVGEPNNYLQAALAAVGRADVQRLSPAAYAPQEWTAADRARHGVDLVLLDQVGKPPPDGMSAWTLAVGLGADATATAQLAKGPEVLVRAGDHPTMRGVSFQDTNFDVVRILPSQPGDRVLAAATMAGGRVGPVMTATEQPVRRLTWGFDLGETDLVGRYALPILVSNALAWLAGEDQTASTPLELGRVWAVDVPNARQDWRYLEPGRAARPARLSAHQAIAASEVFGFHQWQDGTGIAVVRAARLADAETPQDIQGLGTAFAPRPVPTVQAEDAMQLPRYAVWLLVALLAVGAEWLAYLRRRTV